MPRYLLIRLEGPLQAWGDVALDPRRPTRAFPSRSGLAGLLANAFGWEYRDADRTTAMQDALRYAVREDVRPTVLRDYQTADLDAIGGQGWTRWGVEKRGGSAKEGTQILEKYYLADGSLLVALTLAEDAPATLEELAEALDRPARPLFLGRKGCPPACSLCEGWIEAETAYEALRQAPLPRDRPSEPAYGFRCWYSPGDGPDTRPGQTAEVWDRRDFGTQRFAGSRQVVEGRVHPLEAA
ncbi:MAG: type I-E CRISPR-associated protein Cas5/CasD [Longimicrobiaceae bacterium]